MNVPTEFAGSTHPAAGVAKIGVGFGTALAISISWSVNKSIVWAIIHGLLSWLYVAHFAMSTQR